MSKKSFVLPSTPGGFNPPGLPEEEARRKAHIDLGWLAAGNETYREALGLRLIDELGGDIRYGLRALRRNPGFATVAETPMRMVRSGRRREGS